MYLYVLSLILILTEFEWGFVKTNLELMVSDVGKGLMFLVISAFLFNTDRNVDLFVSLVMAVVGLLNILMSFFYSDYEDIGFAQDVKDDEENESLLSFYMKMNNGEKKPDMEVEREEEGDINS